MYKLNAFRMIFFVLLGIAGTTVAHAQASRTWVSGVGDDANPCSRTAPCKTFAGAISKTAAGGEIDVLDPGGFGALTITKAITIDGSGGFIGSVLVAGTNGIVVQAGANDTVILRNLEFDGISGTGNGGFNGIRFLSGKQLHVDHCTIFNFAQNGIDIQSSTAASVFITDTKLQHNGLSSTNAGINISSASVVSAVQVNVTVTNTVSEGSAGRGLFAGDHTLTVVRHSVFNGNTGDGLAANGVSNNALMVIDDTSSSNNGGNGINSLSTSSIRMGNMEIANNLTAAFALSGTGNLRSLGNNNVTGNAAVGPTPSLFSPM